MKEYHFSVLYTVVRPLIIQTISSYNIFCSSNQIRLLQCSGRSCGFTWSVMSLCSYGIILGSYFLSIWISLSRAHLHSVKCLYSEGSDAVISNAVSVPTSWLNRVTLKLYACRKIALRILSRSSLFLWGYSLIKSGWTRFSSSHLSILSGIRSCIRCIGVPVDISSLSRSITAPWGRRYTICSSMMSSISFFISSSCSYYAVDSGLGLIDSGSYLARLLRVC